MIEEKSDPATFGVGAVCDELRVVAVDEGFILGSVVEAFLQEGDVDASVMEVME